MVVKQFAMGRGNCPAFHYDNFSGLYWHGEGLSGKGSDVWWFDKSFNIVSSEHYPHGPWGSGDVLLIPAKPGMLTLGSVDDDERVTLNTRVHYLVYLVTKNSKITEVLEDNFSDGPFVSPDGCKAAFGHASMHWPPPNENKGIAVLKLCND